MNEINKEDFQMDEPKYDRGDEKQFHIPTWTYAILGLVVLGALCYLNFNFDKIATKNAVQQSVVQAPSFDFQLLDGTYTLKTVSEDSTLFSTAVLSMFSEKEFMVKILSDYDPLSLSGRILYDGSLECDQLGSGSFNYNEADKQLTLEFNNTDINKKCVFTKYLK